MGVLYEKANELPLVAKRTSDLIGHTPLVEVTCFYGFSTRAIHVGQEPDVSTGAMITPIYSRSASDHDTCLYS